MRLACFIILAGLPAAFSAGAGIDFHSTNSFSLPAGEVMDRQLWLAAVTAEVSGAVSDDFHALVQTAKLNGDFSGSIWCAADLIEFGGQAQQHARLAAAQDVIVKGQITRSLMGASGGSIHIAPESSIAGDAAMASKRIVIEGRIGGGAWLVGDEVTVAGAIQGPLRIIGNDIVIMPTAVLHGDLIYSSAKELFLDPRVKHDGRLIRRALTQPDELSSKASQALRLQLRLVQFMGAFLVGLIWLRLSPLTLSRAVHQLSVAPWRCFFTGIAACFLVLPIALLLAISIIGIPLALVSAGLFAVLLYVARIVTAILLGRIILRIKKSSAAVSPLLMMTAGLLSLYILTLIPMISGGIWIVAVCAGLGALVLNIAAGSVVYVQPPQAKPPEEISKPETDVDKQE